MRKPRTNRTSRPSRASGISRTGRTSRNVRTTRTRTRTAFILVAALAVNVAVGVAAGGSAGAMGVPRPTPVERLMESRLTVTYADAQDAPARTYTLDCGPTESNPAQSGPTEGNPTEGNPARSEPACERLVEIGGPVRAVPAGQMCSMIYGGPQTGHISGRWRGRVVNEDYRRTNGCEVARWERMVPVLPAVNSANAAKGVQTARTT